MDPNVPILQRLSPTDQNIVIAITALLEDATRQTRDFAARMGLQCKGGCGKCCDNPDVKTTVSEVLPLAVALWGNGQAEDIIKTLDGVKDQGRCVFYKPDPVVVGNGRCLAYAHRPGICRLFGFSAQMDKYGRARLGTCQVIKAQSPDAFAAAQNAMDAGVQAPSGNDFCFKVASIDPNRGRESFPINKAVRLALEHVGEAMLHNPAP